MAASWYAILLSPRFGHIAAHWVEADAYERTEVSHRFSRDGRVVYAAALDMVREVRRYETREQAVVAFRKVRARHGMAGSFAGGVAVDPRNKRPGGVLEQVAVRFGADRGASSPVAAVEPGAGAGDGEPPGDPGRN